MKHFLTFFALVTLILTASCRKDFSTTPSTGDLRFSKDTVYLDTVFTNIGSSTYNLKVYNTSSDAISIPTIALARGEMSNYRLNVDGIAGKSFNDIEILGNDSLYVFVETTVDITTITDPIYTDQIVFDSGANEQEVELVTLVQDAHFLYPAQATDGTIETISLGTDADGESIEIQGFYLDGDTTFTDEKPYVIYGFCAVPADATLTIEAGARLHFHENSGILVEDDATIKVEGELDNEVIFEGDRLEPSFSEVPGQWTAIWLRAGSKNNEIDYAIIKNNSVGIIVDSVDVATNPTLDIKNTQIYNCSNYGILGRQTNIIGENVVIGKAGQSSLACTIGGNYNFKQSTFANYWNNSFRQFPTVLVNNFYSFNDGGSTVVVPVDLTEATFENCIIFGNNNIELLMDKVDGALYNYNFKNNLIRFNDPSGNYDGVATLDFDDVTHYQNNIINGNPDFKAPYENQVFIGDASDCNGQGDATTATNVPLDIRGDDRTMSPDIGAYQHITF